MSQILNRMGNILRANLNTSSLSGKGFTFHDPDEAEAMDELNEFLNQKASFDSDFHASGTKRTNQHTASPTINSEIRQHLKNLESDEDAEWETVKGNYKRLLRKYHPDRHAGDPDKQETATLITQKLNQSYQELKKHYRQN